jgi:hypothetical protein
MKARSTATIALAIAALAAPAAHAAPKKAAPKVCNLVVDDAGDTFVARAQDGTPAGAVGPKEDGFDILSADIASDAKTVTVVIRVKKLSSAIQTSPTGAGFAFDFTLPSSDLQASMRAVYVTGQPAYYEVTDKDPSIPNSPSTYLAPATGFADAKKNEVHISAPVKAFAALGVIKAGTVLAPAADAATSGRAVPPSPGTADQPVATRYVFADVAAGGKVYKTGTPSCVTPGK